MAAVFCVYLAWRNPAWRRVLRPSLSVVAVAATVAGGSGICTPPHHRPET
jgi:hypothetical protein